MKPHTIKILGFSGLGIAVISLLIVTMMITYWDPTGSFSAQLDLNGAKSTLDNQNPSKALLRAQRLSCSSCMETINTGLAPLIGINQRCTCESEKQGWRQLKNGKSPQNELIRNQL